MVLARLPGIAAERVEAEHLHAGARPEAEMTHIIYTGWLPRFEIRELMREAGNAYAARIFHKVRLTCSAILVCNKAWQRNAIRGRNALCKVRFR